MCTTLQKKNPSGAERVANIDRRTAKHVESANVRDEGVQEALDWVMNQIFDNQSTC
jgi:hypothetical protein